MVDIALVVCVSSLRTINSVLPNQLRHIQIPFSNSVQRQHPDTLPARKGRGEQIESNALCGKQKVAVRTEGFVWSGCFLKPMWHVERMFFL